MKQIIRDIELCKLTGETPVGETKRLLDFFNTIFDKIVIKKHDKYPESIFMCVGDEMFFHQDFKNDRLWCRHIDFWSVLSREFRYNYYDIQTIIKYMMEEGLKSKIGTPETSLVSGDWEVEESLKSKVGTPMIERINYSLLLKDGTKSKIGTPELQSNLPISVIEDNLKSRVGTHLY